MNATTSDTPRTRRLGVLFAAAALASLALSGCGGGGGGGDAAPAPTSSTTTTAPAPVPTPVPAPAPATVPAQLTTAAPTYTSAALRDAFNYLNAERLAAGLGVLVQAAELDVAAAGHANYLKVNGFSGGHFQTAGMPGFTAVSATARAQLAGYPGEAQEGYADLNGTPLQAVRALIGMPYHRTGMLNFKGREVGLATSEAALVFEGGLRTGAAPQTMQTAAGGVSVYPPFDATGVDVIMQAETPNPVAAELGAWGPGKYPGYPASVAITGSILSVTSFTVTPVLATGGLGTALPVKILDQNDPNLVALAVKNMAFALPLVPLANGTIYEVKFAGAADGVALTRTWRFTTKANSFILAAPVRVGSTVTIAYDTPGGTIITGAYLFSGCGPTYTPTVTVRSQRVTVSESGVTAPAGCSIRMTVTDGPTGISDTRLISIPTN